MIARRREAAVWFGDDRATFASRIHSSCTLKYKSLQKSDVAEDGAEQTDLRPSVRFCLRLNSLDFVAELSRAALPIVQCSPRNAHVPQKTEELFESILQD